MGATSEKRAEVAKRRERVHELYEGGKTQVDVAIALGVSVGTVRKDVLELRARGLVEARNGRHASVDWEMVKTWWNHGFSAEDIARHAKTTADSIRHVMRRMRDQGIDLWAERDPRRCGLSSDDAA